MLLDRVTARLVEGMHALQVTRDGRLIERLEGDPAFHDLVDPQAVRSTPHRQSSEHRVRATAQPPKHRPRLGEVGGFVQHMVVDAHRRVGAEHEILRVPRTDPIRLQRGIVEHHVPRIGIRRFVLGHRRRDDFERDSELREEFAAARRGGGKNKARHVAQLAGNSRSG